MQVKPYWKSSNVSIVAALGALGVGWWEPDKPCTNIYGKDEPIPRDKNGRPVKPGNVTFWTSRKSEAFWGVKFENLLGQWKETTADVELDNLIRPDESDSKEVARLKQSVSKILPLAIFCYLRAGFKNRKEVANVFRYVKPQRGWVDANGESHVINADASDDRKREVGA